MAHLSSRVANIERALFQAMENRNHRRCDGVFAVVFDTDTDPEPAALYDGRFYVPAIGKYVAGYDNVFRIPSDNISTACKTLKALYENNPFCEFDLQHADKRKLNELNDYILNIEAKGAGEL